MRIIAFILIFVIVNGSLSGQDDGYSLINYIPRIGNVHHETLEIEHNNAIVKAYKEIYLDGLIQFYRYFRSDKNIFIVIDKDSLYFNDEQEIINGYKTEYYDEFEYLILSRYNKYNRLMWSKGYYLGKEIKINVESFTFNLKPGSILSECRCLPSENSLEDLKWIQFYDANNIKRLQLFDESTQIERNIEFYYGNKVAIYQTYYSYTEHTDSIYNRKGELLYVYKYDENSNLITKDNTIANNIIYNLIDSEFAWDFFYPFNHCSESMLIGSNN